MEEKEVWKPIKNYVGLYEVSNMGNVKSLGNGKSCNKNYSKERILKLTKNKLGYLYVSLYKDGVKKSCRVHRLVAIAFIPNPQGYKEINHRDENKGNNCVENLEWCSRSYNNTYNNKAKKIGEKVSEKLRNDPNRSKAVIATNKETGQTIVFPSLMEASRQLGIRQGHITECCQGKRKSDGGYTFVYVNEDKEVNNE